MGEPRKPIIEIVCPRCWERWTASADLIGRAVRCPNTQCGASIEVKAEPEKKREPDDGDKVDSRATPGWLALGASVLICLAVGGAGGVVFGHRQGKSNDVRELTEAKNRADQAVARAESAAQRQKSLEDDLAGALTKQAREKERLESVIKVRDQQLIASNEAAFEAKAQVKAAEERLETVLAKVQRDAEMKKPAEVEKQRIPTIALTDERKRKSEADAEYVNRKLQSTNRSILKGMTMLFGFNSLCENDNVTKESIARVVGDDRDLLITAAQMLTDVGSYIPSKSKKGLTLQESWDICMEALGVKK